MGNTSGLTAYHNPFSNAIEPGPSISATASFGAHAFEITSGTQVGKTLVVRGNVFATTNLYDPATHTFSAGPSLTGNASTGAHSSGIAAGPALMAITGNGSQTLKIPSDLHAGKILVVHGNTTVTTSLYDPGTNTFSAGKLVNATGVPNSGAHSLAP